jgi:hypothetical protein
MSKAPVHVHEGGVSRAPDYLLADRDRRRLLDAEARDADPNVLLGLTPPFYRSALAARERAESVLLESPVTGRKV